MSGLTHRSDWEIKHENYLCFFLQVASRLVATRPHLFAKKQFHDVLPFVRGTLREVLKTAFIANLMCLQMKWQIVPTLMPAKYEMEI